MFTPYAVMSWNERYVAKTLLAGHGLTTTYDRHCRTRMLNKKWLAHDWGLTTLGQVAYELREILGPDRELTKAQAGALVKYGLTPSMQRKLVGLGLLETGVPRRYTEDGEKIRAVLVKYGVSL